MDNNLTPISGDSFLNKITPEQSKQLWEDIQNRPLNLGMTINEPKLFEIDPKSTPVYKLQQILEQSEKQANELKIANEHLGDQNKLLEQQLDLAQEQKSMLETKFENEKIEKDNAIKESKKNKVWGVVGKILSGIVGLIAFAIIIFTAVYPEKSKEIISLIWKTIFPGS